MLLLSCWMLPEDWIQTGGKESTDLASEWNWWYVWIGQRHSLPSDCLAGNKRQTQTIWQSHHAFRFFYFLKLNSKRGWFICYFINQQFPKWTMNSFCNYALCKCIFRQWAVWSMPLDFLVQHVRGGGSASTRASPLQGKILVSSHLISPLKWAFCLAHAKEPGEVSSSGD